MSGMTASKLMFDAHGVTDRGRCRSRNEDSLVLVPAAGLVLVCDGMGGHVGGEVASSTATRAAEQFARGHQRDDWPFGRDEHLTEGGNVLRNATLVANRSIAERIEAEPWLARMGTTLVAALWRGDGHVDLANVGDSRAYLWRGGELSQLTSDHSWVNEQVQLGVLTRDEASRHPLKNVITRALGSVNPLPVDVLEEHLEVGDRLLLCSDGLTTMLDDSAIAARFGDAALDAEAVCLALVDAANTAGGEDNITVAVVCVGTGHPSG